MMCQSNGRPPISISGFGRTIVILILVPNPPASMTAFILRHTHSGTSGSSSSSTSSNNSQKNRHYGIDRTAMPLLHKKPHTMGAWERSSVDKAR